MTVASPTDSTTALLLLAHGSRQTRWREPIDQIAQQLRTQHKGICELAFLEFMPPNLPQALQHLAERGQQRIIIVPLFWSTGEHVARDIAAQVAEFATQHPHISIHTSLALGQAPAVQDAVASYALSQFELHTRPVITS